MKKILFLAAALIGSANANANLIVNGGFEANPVAPGAYTFFIPSGWTGCGSTTWVEAQNGAVTPSYAGSNLLEIDSGNCISQSFATVAGATYLFNFAYTPRPGYNSNFQTTVTGGAAPSVTNYTPFSSTVAWTVASQSFTAVGTSAAIQFLAQSPVNSGAGAFLDAVSIECTSRCTPVLPAPPTPTVPAPTPLVLIGLGLVTISRFSMTRFFKRK